MKIKLHRIFNVLIKICLSFWIIISVYSSYYEVNLSEKRLESPESIFYNNNLDPEDMSRDEIYFTVNNIYEAIYFKEKNRLNLDLVILVCFVAAIVSELFIFNAKESSVSQEERLLN
jgi:hypothetical protein